MNLDAKRRESEVRITMVENQKLDSKNLEAKLQKIDATCGKLEAQIKNYDDQLIHKITAKDDIRKILNTVFSQEFAALPSKLVKRKSPKLEQH